MKVMNLEQFINTEGWIYESDIDIIMAFIAQAGLETELIGRISELAASISDKAKKDAWRNFEWSNYAFSAFVNPDDINAETPDYIVLNAVRLAYMGFSDKKQFRDIALRILKNKGYDASVIMALHPDIYEVLVQTIDA